MQSSGVSKTPPSHLVYPPGQVQPLGTNQQVRANSIGQTALATQNMPSVTMPRSILDSNPYKMYSLAMNPLEIKSVKEFLAIAHADLYEGNRVIVLKGDTLFHIFARAMVYDRRNDPYSHWRQLIEQFSKFYIENQEKLFDFKNSQGKCFYEIKGLTSLEGYRLLHSLKFAGSFSDKYDKYPHLYKFKEELMYNLLHISFDEFVHDSFQDFLKEFIIISKISSGTEDENILHWLVKKIWAQGSPNTLIRNNFLDLTKFLKNSPSKDDLENKLLLQLIVEKNHEGKSCFELYEELELRYIFGTQAAPPPTGQTQHKAISISSPGFLGNAVLYQQSPLKFDTILSTEDSLKYEMEEDWSNNVTLRLKCCDVGTQALKGLSSALVSKILSKEDVKLNVLLGLLSLRLTKKCSQPLCGLKGDRFMHVLVRLKHQFGPVFRESIEKNIHLIETILNSQLNEEERIFFLDAKNADGLDYRELDQQLRELTAAQMNLDNERAFEVCGKLSYPRYSCKLDSIYPMLMLYNYALSPNLLKISPKLNLLSLRADSTFIFPYGRESKELVRKGDSLFHILIRYLCHFPNAPKHQIEKLITLAILNFKNGGSRFLGRFWEIGDLSDFDKEWLFYWNLKIQEKFSKDIKQIYASELFFEKFLNDFYRLEFKEIVDELKNNLSSFLLHSKKFSDFYSKTTVLHKIVKKIWESGTKNEFICKNLEELIKFLKNSPTKDNFENILIEKLFFEKDRESRNYIELNKELEQSDSILLSLIDNNEQALKNEKYSFTNQDHFLLILSIDQAREKLLGLSQNNEADRRSIIQGIIKEAMQHFSLNLTSQSELANINIGLATQKFEKKLTKLINQA